MERILKGYEPEKLYWYFEELTRIPRGSGNEKAVADFICGEAEKDGLWYYRDQLFNVLVRIPGCGGLENEAPVILQGHTDVVCEKNSDVIHDFTKDPVDMYVEDGWLKTRGTTLGADNGTACAIMLMMMAQKGGKHPPLECLFTAQEETGMGGARGFDYSKIKGRTLINMDSGSRVRVTVSCAGAEYTKVTFSCQKTPAPGTALNVSLTGLAGGHSGIGINRGLGNSILLLARLLSTAKVKVPFRLSSFNGGNKANAIPREAFAQVVTEDPEGFKAEIERIEKDLRRELIEADKDMTLRVEEAESDGAFSREKTDDILFFLELAPNGPIAFVPTDRSFVETSSNVGVIRTEDDKVVVTVMPRSSLESRMDEAAHRLDLLASRTGAVIEHNDRHPGWEYAPTSRLRDVHAALYKELTGEDVTFKAVHGGLECGIICTALGGADAIAMGTHSQGAHTPAEKLDIADLAAAYDYLNKLLARL